MGSLHAGCPWRGVVHIEVTEPGPQGGRAWWLTLECKHTAIRPYPSFKPGRAIARFMHPPRLAPKRVRCWHCGHKEIAA